MGLLQIDLFERVFVIPHNDEGFFFINSKLKLIINKSILIYHTNNKNEQN